MPGGAATDGGRGRGQASLPALAVALLVLTATLVLTVGVAERARGDAARPAEERHLARSLSERLVDPAGSLADRQNVLNASRLAGLDAARLGRDYPVADEASVAVTLDDAPVVGDSALSGTSVERVVLVERRTTRTITPSFTGGNSLTVPRRTGQVTLDIAPPAGVDVTRVRAGDRVVLAAPDGLSGRHVVALSRFDTTRLTFAATGRLPRGSVTATVRPATTEKAVLRVTVDA